jgi:hypothetical protein
MREESERGEKVEHSVEPAGPFGRHAPHVPAHVAKPVARPTLSRHVEQILRVVESVDIVSEFGEQVRVPTLAARDIEYARADRETKNFDESSHFLPVALGREEKPVLTEIVGVECRLPPLARFLQKKTGSR